MNIVEMDGVYSCLLQRCLYYSLFVRSDKFLIVLLVIQTDIRTLSHI